MRSKIHAPTINIKLILLIFFLLFLLLAILRSSLSSPPKPTSSATSPSSVKGTNNECNKIPPSLADAVIHYATSNVTPQQTFKEISVTARVLERKSPCNFLVFGLGHDSPMWSALNHGGRIVFLEEDAEWIQTVTSKFRELEAYHVEYDTKVRDADELMELGRRPECQGVAGGDARRSACRLALRKLPAMVYEMEWDLIMVDAPTGWIPDAPGRMGAIYTAGMAARGRSEGETDIFVHDVDRKVEDTFSKEFLCEGYMKEQEGRIRHFTIPSHRSGETHSFCP